MKVKCPNKDCCTCHNGGHEWEADQKSKYYVLCPMCRKHSKISEVGNI